MLEDVMQQTDWALLSRRKLVLLQLLRTVDEANRPDILLYGLLNWIDTIQDAAEKAGYPVVWLEDKE